MFNSDDIEAMGSLNMGERQSMGLGAGNDDQAWDELINLRLKQDGGYSYWKPRGGTVDEGFASINHKYGFFFKARVKGDINKYFARQKSSGEVTVYEYPSKTVVKSISGFTTSGKVQFVPIGELLYMFDGSQSKYLNLRTKNVHDYLGNTPSNITSVSYETTSSVSELFGLREGGRAIVFPIDKDKVNKVITLKYRGYYENATEYSELPFDKADPNVTSGDWTVLFGNATSENKLIIEGLLKPNLIYKYDPSTGDMDPSIKEYIDTSQSDSNGYVYFTVSTESTVIIKYDGGSGDQIPYLREMYPGTANFNEARLGTVSIKEFTGSEYLSIVTDDGQTIYYKNIQDGTILNDQFQIVGYDESLESFVGTSRFEEIDSSGQITKPNGGRDTVTITTLNDSGGVIYNDSTSEYTKRYYRSYAIVDVLDDGSTVLNGRPTTVSFDPVTDRIGATLTIENAESNVARRYLCGSKYITERKQTYTPSTSENPNSPWFIIREISTSDNKVFDGSSNDDLVRPINEILPVAAGIPSIFGKGQLTPKSVSPHKDIFVIGGYKINRPTPSVYTTDSNGGNIYVDQSGVDTINTAYFVFEYTDGTYSSSDTITIKDGGSEAQVHSLNLLVSKVHLYVNDGSTTWKIQTYTQDDAEFMGYPIPLPTSFTEYESSTIPTDKQESVLLHNYVTVPVPPQQIYISGQGQVFGNSSIVKTIPLDYDTDKSMLRYRLLVFTEDNIQTGYIAEVDNQGNIGYNVDFEVTDESRRALKAECIFRVGGSIFFQDSNGIHAIQGNRAEKIIPKERFDFLSNELTSVAYNEAEDELWFLFGGGKVYVLDTDNGYKSLYDFGSLNLNDAHWFDDKFHVLTDNKLCEADKVGTGTDLGTAITATATSRYIGSQQIQTLLHEVLIYGVGGKVSLLLDDGRYRQEKHGSPVTSFDFAESQSFSQLNNQAYGALFTPRVRGIKQRIQLEMTGDFQIEDIELKLSRLSNEGMARLSP